MQHKHHFLIHKLGLDVVSVFYRLARAGSLNVSQKRDTKSTSVIWVYGIGSVVADRIIEIWGTVPANPLHGKIPTYMFGGRSANVRVGEVLIDYFPVFGVDRSACRHEPCPLIGTHNLQSSSPLKSGNDRVNKQDGGTNEFQPKLSTASLVPNVIPEMFSKQVFKPLFTFLKAAFCFLLMFCCVFVGLVSMHSVPHAKNPALSGILGLFLLLLALLFCGCGMYAIWGDA